MWSGGINNKKKASKKVWNPWGIEQLAMDKGVGKRRARRVKDTKSEGILDLAVRWTISQVSLSHWHLKG